MRRPFVRLARHFFERFFDSELNTGEGGMQVGMGAVLALLALPGLFLPLLLFDKYSSLLRFFRRQTQWDFDAASMPDKYLFLAVATTVMGLATVLKWDSLFPDRRDHANLAILPISSTAILGAKFSALIVLLLVLLVDLNLVPSLLFPAVVLEERGTFPEYLRFAGAHFVSVTASCSFAFFFFLSVAGVLMLVLPYRWFRRVSVWLQAISVVVLLTMLLISPRISLLANQLRSGGHPLADYLPTVWFLGLYQELHGKADATDHALAIRAVQALAVAVGVALFCYAASYGGYLVRIAESAEESKGTPGWLQRRLRIALDGSVLRSGFDRGCFWFSVKTLVRSKQHLLVLTAYVGAGLAVALQQLLVALSGSQWAARQFEAALYSLPLIAAFATISGLRIVFALPAELKANWIFQIATPSKIGDGRGPARNVMLAFLLPLLVGVCLPLYTWLWGFPQAAFHVGYVLAFSLLLMEASLLRFHKIPFTCSWVPGNNPVLRAALHLAGFYVFAVFLADIERTIANRPIVWVILGAILAAIYAGLRSAQRQGEDNREKLTFEEHAEPAVQPLTLLQ